MDKKNFSSHDEMMAYYEEELHKLEARAKRTFSKERKAEIGAEIERQKRLIAYLRKTGGNMGYIQYAGVGKCSTEVLSNG